MRLSVSNSAHRSVAPDRPRRRLRGGLIWKFLAVVLPLALLLNLVFLHWYMDLRRQQVFGTLAAETAALHLRLAQAVRAALDSGDAGAARVLLKSAAGSPAVRCVEMVQGGVIRAAWPAPGCRGETENLLSRPVMLSGERAEFRLQYRRAPAEARLLAEQRYIQASLGFSALTVVIAALIAHRLTIGRPLARLLASIDAVEYRAHYLPVDWRSRDELGVVIGAYNRMLAVSESRLGELKALNQALETEIDSRRKAEADLQSAQAQLIQSSKMEALGTLAGGIAHEINTPTQYVADNIAFLRRAYGDFRAALSALIEFLAAADAVPQLAPARMACGAVLAQRDLAFILEETPPALDQAADGIGTIRTIVASMKDFTRPHGDARDCVSLPKVVDNALTMTANHWRGVAEISTDIAPEIAPVAGSASQLTQCVIALLGNAVDAITQAGRAGRGQIALRLCADAREARLSVADNGTGVAAEIAERLFEPFFTTKEVGAGTGQGLSQVYDVVVRQHGGRITHENQPGGGACFELCLPVGRG